jgi:hypothetical protein
MRLVVMVRIPRPIGERKARFRQRLATAARIASHRLQLKWDESARRSQKAHGGICDFGNFAGRALSHLSLATPGPVPERDR